MKRKIILYFYLICQILSLTRGYFLHFWGEGMMTLFTYSSYGSLFLATSLIFLYGGRISYFTRFSRTGVYLLFLYAFFSLGLLSYGLITFSSSSYLINDFTTFLSLGIFIMLGSVEAFWRDLIPAAIFLLIPGILINVLALPIVNVNESIVKSFLELEGTHRIARVSLAYETKSAIAYCLFLVLLSPILKKNQFMLVAGAVVFLFLLQILFQKRGPTARILILVFTFIFFTLRNRYRRGGFKVSRSKKIYLLVFGFFFSLGLVQVIPAKMISDQFTGLINRFQGDRGYATNYEGGRQKYEQGALGIFTTENERIGEVILMFNDFNSLNYIIGKGFGGSWEDNSKLYAKRDLRSGKYIKESVHIGWFNLVLKGGFIFLMLMLGIFVYAIFPVKYHLGSVISIAALIFVSIWSLFFFAEGWFYFSSNSMDNMFLGACLGRLISDKKRLRTN